MSQTGVTLEDARAILAAQGGSGAPGGLGGADDEVRAPIAPTQGRLFGDHHGAGGPFARPGAATQVSFRNFEEESRRLEAEKRAKRRLADQKDSLGSSSAVYGLGSDSASAKKQFSAGHDDEYVYEYESDDGDLPMTVSRTSTTREQNLQTLFQPPREILFSGSFDQARAHAKAEKRWLLVNIQKDSEFFSYVLNRDLWQADLIRDIVSTSFVFFQHDHGDHEAEMYARFYKPQTFPHIAIIDPRTGELLLTLDLKTRANENDPNDLRSSFLDKVSKFLEDYSMSAPPSSNTPPPGPAAARPQSNQSAVPAPAPAPPPAPARATPAAPSAQVGQVLSALGSPSPAAQSTLDLPPLEDEPRKDDPSATQVRIRLPNGKMVTRTFLGSSQVGQIFSLVRSLVPETESRDFDVVSGLPPTSLRDKLDSTLEAENLLRAAVSAKWV